MLIYQCAALLTGQEEILRHRAGDAGETAETDHRENGDGSHRTPAGRGQTHPRRARESLQQVPGADETPQERGQTIRVPAGSGDVLVFPDL